MPDGNDLWAIDPAGMLSVTDDGTGAWFLDYNGSLPVLRFVDDNGSEHARASITGGTVHQLAATSDGNAIASLRSSSSQVSINGESVFSGESNQSLLVKLKTNGAVAWTLPLGGQSSTIGLLARGSDDFVWAMGEVTGDEGEVLSHGDYSISLQGGGSVTDGLVAWYPFDGNAQDMSGNGNHGIVNGASLTTDRFGQVNKASSFDGANDRIDLGHHVLNPGNYDVTCVHVVSMAIQECGIRVYSIITRIMSTRMHISASGSPEIAFIAKSGRLGWSESFKLQKIHGIICTATYDND